jgi:hypothetical protein
MNDFTHVERDKPDSRIRQLSNRRKVILESKVSPLDKVRYRNTGAYVSCRM